MNPAKIPQTDSIQQLAEFWDTHDVTDFQDELEEVAEPVFQRRAMLTIPLQPEEMDAIKEIAQSKGVVSADLIRQWVIEKIHGG